MKWLQLSVLCVGFSFFLSGCVGKTVYEPKKVDAEVKAGKSLKHGIHNVVREGAVLDKKSVVTRKSGMIEAILPSGFYFINESEGNIIAGNNNGEVQIISKTTKKPLFSKKFAQPAVSATQKGDLLALVLADNTIVLYDIGADSERYRESLGKVIAIDARAAMFLPEDDADYTILFRISSRDHVYMYIKYIMNNKQ